MVKHGFTLIELLVVMAVIAILASGVIVALGPTRIKARDTKRKSDLSQLRTAIEAYTDSKGEPPLSSAKSGCTGACVVGNVVTSANWGAMAIELKDYLPKMPTDAREGIATKFQGYAAGAAAPSEQTAAPAEQTYSYKTDSFGYEINAILENDADGMRNTGNAGDAGNNDLRYEVGAKLTLIP